VVVLLQEVIFLGSEAAAFGGRAFRNARVIAGVFIFAALQGCAGFAPQTAALLDGMPEGMPLRAELTEVPFFPQQEYQCGPAALATVLVSSGVKTTPEALVPQVYLPARKGSLQVEMLAAARRHGLVSYQLAPSFVDLMRELAAGTPVVVLQNLGISEGWHYAVAVGYDYKLGQMILRSGITEREEMPFAVHEMVWKRSGYWAMVAVPPERIPATAQEDRWLSSLVAFERSNQPASNRAAYSAFLQRWPDNVNAAIGLANAHYALHDLPQAEKVLRAALERSPDSVIALNNLAQTLSDQGREAEALPIAERAVAAGGPHAAAVQQTRDEILKKIESRKN
jgi:peptidase C39-like protein/tetratricopeptide repeat protein